jgi:gliding motility-associated-like protein
MARAPAYINADYATLNNDNTVNLSFTLDPASELKNYILMRSAYTTGKFDTIANLVALGSKISYTDNSSVTDGQSFYKLVAINNCNFATTYSNLASTIILSGEYNNPVNTLSWTPYISWRNDVKEYRIYRRFGDNQAVSIATTSDSTYTDNEIANLEYGDLSGEVCYYIKAAENPGNPYYTNAESTSNEFCISITPSVKIPNAFTPNHDGINDTFHPLLSYIPRKYHFQIFDRWGIKVYDTTDPNAAWDGVVRGKPGTSGVYVYFLELTDYNNQIIKQNGHVTLVYP